MPRKYTFRSFLIVVALLIALSVLAPLSASAQGDKTLRWQQFNATLDVQRNGQMNVTETQQINFLSGTWHNGYREFSLDRVDDITNMRVFLKQGSNLQPLQTVLQQSGNKLDVTWRFPQVTGDSTRTFVLKYTLSGVIRLYQSNDQILWTAVPSARKYPVQSSTVTLHLPGNVSPSRVKLATYPQRLRGSAAPQDNGFVFKASNIPAAQGFEIRAGFPKGVVTTAKPSWQAQADQQDYITQSVQPIVNLVLLVLGFAIPVFGLVGLLALWITKGKDPDVGRDPQSVNEPPSDLPAPLVGVLLDERADTRDVISTLLSLAEQGVITITPVENPKLLGSNHDFKLTLHEDKASEDLRPYEKTLINNLFYKNNTVQLSKVKGSFLASMKLYQSQLYEEVERAGLFRNNPERVRNRYRNNGIAIIVIAIIMGIAGLALLSSYATSFYILFPVVGLTAVGFALIKLSQVMPVRTTNGAVEASRWRSFRNYLKTIEQRSDLEQKPHLFDKYLSYATVFELGKSWLRKFSLVGTPAPAWYRAGAGHQYAGRGYAPGAGVPPIIFIPPMGGYYGGGDNSGNPANTGNVPQGTDAGNNPGGIDPSVFGGGQPPLDQAANSFGDLLDMAGQVFGGDDGGWTGGNWGGGGGWGGGGAGGFGGGSGDGGAGFS